jgi:hypothetical protein
MSFEDLVTEDMRLVILKALYEDADYSHNEHVIKSALGLLGHKVSSDRVRTELAWLKEQALVETREVSGVIIAKLTRRGADVAQGRTTVPGVKRPEPM